MGRTYSTESWDHVSPGPDHSDISSKWGIDPKRWVVQWKPRDATEDAYREVGMPAWSGHDSYRMRLLLPTVVGVVPSRPWPQAGEVDPLGKDAHEPGAKLDAGKLRVDLVLGGFARALQEVAAVGTYGAQKYTDNGWSQVPDGQRRYADAAMRHYLERKAGQPLDEGTGLLHLAHQAWNVLAELELLLRESGRS